MEGSKQQSPPQESSQIFRDPQQEVVKSLQIIPYQAPIRAVPLRSVPAVGGLSTPKERGRPRQSSDFVKQIASSALPKGWLERVTRRTCGRQDKIYIEERTQKQFRSLSTARAYVEKCNGPTDWSQYDQGRKYVRKPKPAKGTEPNATTATAGNTAESTVAAESSSAHNEVEEK